MSAAVHALVPPVGSLEATSCPCWVPATHIWAEAQAMSVKSAPSVYPPKGVADHAPVVEVRTSAAEVAAHRPPLAGHEIDPRPAGFRGSICQALGGPVGSLEYTALPASSTATHQPTDGHDTPVRLVYPCPRFTSVH